MEERAYHSDTARKAGWGPGPWMDEPDKLQFADEATGLPCLIVRNRIGALCGYVGVAPGHPLHGVDHHEVEERLEIEVHGGLTYSSFCDEGGPEEHAICHLPGPGEEEHVWWLGFDTAHGFDQAPGLEAELRATDSTLPALRNVTYKTVGYVRRECAELARQLEAAAAA